MLNKLKLRLRALFFKSKLEEELDAEHAEFAERMTRFGTAITETIFRTTAWNFGTGLRNNPTITESLNLNQIV